MIIDNDVAQYPIAYYSKTKDIMILRLEDKELIEYSNQTVTSLDVPTLQ